MLQRCREVFMTDTSKKLNGVIEADETFIGGRDKNRHANKKKHIGGHGGMLTVLGMVQRGGRPVATVVDNVKLVLSQPFENMSKWVRFFIRTALIRTIR